MLFGGVSSLIYMHLLMFHVFTTSCLAFIFNLICCIHIRDRYWRFDVAVVIRNNKYMIDNIGNKDRLEIGILEIAVVIRGKDYILLATLADPHLVGSFSAAFPQLCATFLKRTQTSRVSHTSSDVHKPPWL